MLRTICRAAAAALSRQHQQQQLLTGQAPIISSTGRCLHTTTLKASSTSAFKELLVSDSSDSAGVQLITLNRVKKRNALSLNLFEEVTRALHQAAEEPSCIIAALTGGKKALFSIFFIESRDDLMENGAVKKYSRRFTPTVYTGDADYFTAGIDLSIGLQLMSDPSSKSKIHKVLREFLFAFIDFPKPIAALVNGHAIGVGVTILAHLDAVYAADKATFHAPFPSIGLIPEACSTILFPRMMGTANASEMLVLGRRYNANEAKERMLVTDVFPSATLQADAMKRLVGYAESVKHSRESLHDSKNIMRQHERQYLKDVTDKELENVFVRITSEEFRKIAASFLAKASVKKS